MRSIWLLLPLIVFVTACEVTVVEPVYDGRDRLVGRYTLQEYSEKYDDVTYYDLYISKSTYAAREIRLVNFYAADITVFAYLDGDRITIPLQTVDGYRVEGAGTYYGDDIVFNYSVKDVYQDLYTDFCESTARRN